MKTRSRLLLLGMLGLLIVSSLDPTESKNGDKDVIIEPIIKFDSGNFPGGFYFGSATSAYQTEGEANTKGRGPSIWDTFAHEFPERIADGSNGDVATDFYNLYQSDLLNMNQQLGLNAFRFSISWSRIIPSGRIREGINEEGIGFYNRVIDEAIRNGLVPFVTIFHWDLPQALEDKYGGFLSPDIVPDFRDYAELCFQRFGDRVKHWITFNEPYIFTVLGYDSGRLAPGRCSSWVSRACVAGDSATEPYIVGHHVLLVHAEAVDVYRKLRQDGKIGLTLDVAWPIPYTDNVADRQAAQITLDFVFGWFMDPITYGQYPRVMRDLVTGNRLPNFTAEQSKKLKGSSDFIGLNYYYSNYASDKTVEDPDSTQIRYLTDSGVNLTTYGEHPEGLRYLLNYTKNTYKDPIIYITETGLSDDDDLSPEDALQDTWRINYFKSHYWNVLRSICEDKVKVKGLFAWSYMDNFEWANGFKRRFGLYQVDRNNNLERKPKLSVAWFNKFLKNKRPTGDPICIAVYNAGSRCPADLEEL